MLQVLYSQMAMHIFDDPLSSVGCPLTAEGSADVHAGVGLGGGGRAHAVGARHRRFDP
jgi:hypothetical protein